MRKTVLPVPVLCLSKAPESNCREAPRQAVVFVSIDPGQVPG